jgi:hypothetical protein
MKASRSSYVVVVIVAFLTATVSEASLITYSGSGLVTLNSGKPDPWGIGSSKPFTFGINVASDATDDSSLVDRARYGMLSATVSINGTSATVTPSGPLQFIDNMWLYGGINAYSDEVLATLNVTLNGYTQPLTIVQYLAPSTFTFSHAYEPLPVFDTNTRYDGPTVSSYDYATFFPANSPFGVAAVPEPSACAVWGLGTVAFLFVMKRRRKRI